MERATVNGCMPRALASLLKNAVSSIREEKIPLYYREILQEGMKNFKGLLRENFKNYLLISKNPKLEIIAREMEKDENFENYSIH